MHGGNLFRNADADEETVASHLFRTPRGDPIVQFNKAGHFQVPDESSSDEEESEIALKTPAPQKSNEAPKPKILLASPWRAPGTPAPAAAAQATQSGSSAPAATPVLKGILKNTSYTPKVYPYGQWEPRQETIARNRREALEAIEREKAENARKRELAEEARKKAIVEEETIARNTATAKAHALKYAPKEPSKLNFVEQAASSPPAAPSEKSFIEATSSAETGDNSPTATKGAEASPAAQDEDDALTDNGSDDGSSSSEGSEEDDSWRGDYPMSARAIKWVNSQELTAADVEASAKKIREEFEEFKKTWVCPDFKCTPRVRAWLESDEVQACVREDTPIIAAEIRRSFERGYAL